MKSVQLTCMKSGHDNQAILGICLSEYCQADQKIACISCLQTIHVKCITDFCSTQQFIKRLAEIRLKTQQDNEYEMTPTIKELNKQTQYFNKLVEQFVNGVNQSYDKVSRITLIDQILRNQSQLSSNDWESGYSLLNYLSVVAPLNTNSLIEQLQIIKQLIDKISANIQDKMFQGIVLSDQFDDTQIIIQENNLTTSASMQAERNLEQRVMPIWHTITTQTPLIIIAQHRIKTISLSPEGKYIASAGNNDNYSINIWDPITKKQVGNNLIGHKDMITSIQYSKCGKYIVSASADKTIRQWNTYTQEQVGESMKGHEDQITGVQYTPDRKYVISCSRDQTVRIWNSETGIEEVDMQIQHVNQILSLSLSPKCSKVLIGDMKGLIMVYNYQRQQKSGQFHLGHKECVNSVQYSTDGKLFVSGSDDNTVKLWDSKSLKLIRSFRDHESYVLSVNFSPDKKFIISGGCDRTVRIWSQVTGRRIGDPLTHHQKSVCSTQFSVDGKHIITGGWGAQLRIMVSPTAL